MTSVPVGVRARRNCDSLRRPAQLHPERPDPAGRPDDQDLLAGLNLAYVP
jgi:hypothetical protein